MTVTSRLYVPILAAVAVDQRTTPPENVMNVGNAAPPVSVTAYASATSVHTGEDGGIPGSVYDVVGEVPPIS